MASVLGIILFYGQRLVSNCSCARNFGTFDIEAVSELTNTQHINEKLATFRLCTLFISSIICFLMSNSCIESTNDD